MARAALAALSENIAPTNHESLLKDASIVKPTIFPSSSEQELARIKSELLRSEKIIEEQQSLIAELRRSLVDAVRIHEQDQERIQVLNNTVAQIPPLQSHLAQISMMYSLVQMH